MARKHNDAPIKLIHILPGSEESSSSDSVGSGRTPFRLGIEGAGHSASNFYRFLKNLLPKSSHSSAGILDDLAQSEEPEGLSILEHSFTAHVRSWFERLGTLWMRFYATIMKSGRNCGVDGPSSSPTSPYALLEGEADHLGIPEIQTEASNTLGGQIDPLSFEIDTLRDQVRFQQEDLARVTFQLTDLKNLMLSQQQVLVHLGKDMEGIHLAATVPPPKTPRKSKPRVAKSPKTKTVLPKKQPKDQPPSLGAHS